MARTQLCDTCQETWPLTLWVPGRAARLSWVQLARYQASIHRDNAQAVKILKYFRVSWQIVSVSRPLPIPTHLAF